MTDVKSREAIASLGRSAAVINPLGTNAVVVSPWPLSHPAFRLFEREFVKKQHELIAEAAS